MAALILPLDETDRPRLILVDINVLGISSMRQWAYLDKEFKGRPTAALHGTFDKLIRLLAEFADHIPIILWDDRCYWREAILPSYKRHRWETHEQIAFLQSYLAQATIVRQMIGYLGIPQVFCPGFEADDLAGLLCRKINQNWSVVLATSDSDWFQALRQNVIWHSPLTGRQVTVHDLNDPEIFSNGPFDSTDHFIQAKALAGDSSDGILGVAGAGIKTAARIIREHGSLEVLWAKHDNGEVLKGVVLLRVAGPEYRHIYQRNLTLVDWRLAPPLPRTFEFEMNTKKQIDYEAACEAWGLTTAIRRFGSECAIPDSTAIVGSDIAQILAAGR